MRVSRSVLLFCLATSVPGVGTARAQTYVVDAAGGGNFTDLPQAIAAVPSGAVLLVRPGTYSAFRVTNRSLAILGDNPNTVIVDFAFTDIVIGPTQAGERVLLHNLHIKRLQIGGGLVSISAALGEVVLDHVTIDTAPNTVFQGQHRLQISGCPNVHLANLVMPALAASWSGLGRVEVIGSNVAIRSSSIFGTPSSSLFSLATGPALSAVNSLVFCVNSSFVGGLGAAAQGCGLPTTGPSNGGPGARLTAGSIVHAVGCTFTGGVGGSGIACRPAGARGGDGLEIDNARMRAIGTTFTGGVGGFSGGASGVPIVAGSGAIVEVPGVPAVTSALRGIASPGQTVTCSMQGVAGDIAVLAFGYEQTFFPLDPVVLTGALLVVPLVVLGPFSVPVGGVLDVPISLPLTWPIDQWIPFQFIAGPPTLTELWAANSAAILAR